jgi:hypothetical protein
VIAWKGDRYGTLVLRHRGVTVSVYQPRGPEDATWYCAVAVWGFDETSWSLDAKTVDGAKRAALRLLGQRARVMLEIAGEVAR